jgi:hypothetical protein
LRLSMTRWDLMLVLGAVQRWKADLMAARGATTTIITIIAILMGRVWEVATTILECKCNRLCRCNSNSSNSNSSSSHRENRIYLIEWPRCQDSHLSKWRVGAKNNLTWHITVIEIIDEQLYIHYLNIKFNIIL